MNIGRWRSLGIFVVGMILSLGVMQFEAPVVLELFRNPNITFRNFMANSYFEGRPFGGSDIGVTIAVVAFLVWIYRRKDKNNHSSNAQTSLKFLWLTALCTAVFAVHSLKWIFSRARPKMILSIDMTPESLVLMTWPGFMSWDGPRGVDYNSFPSGHTASCAIMIAYAYLLWPKHRGASSLVFAVVTIYSCMMAAARSMSGMHWISDSIASYFLAWMIVDIFAKRLNISSPSVPEENPLKL